MTTFYDANQVSYELPPGEPVSWRISAYPLVIKDKKVLVIKPRWSERWELPAHDHLAGDKTAKVASRTITTNYILHITDYELHITDY